MLILPIRSRYNICPFQTGQMCATSHGTLQYAPNAQNQHFKELRHKVGMQVQNTVILRSLANFDTKYELYVTKKRKKQSAKLGLDRI